MNPTPPAHDTDPDDPWPGVPSYVEAVAADKAARDDDPTGDPPT